MKKMGENREKSDSMRAGQMASKRNNKVQKMYAQPQCPFIKQNHREPITYLFDAWPKYMAYKSTDVISNSLPLPLRLQFRIK